MNHSFNELEMLRIAVEMERTGQQFYRSVLSIAKNPDARRLLEVLAGQEEEHMAAFQRMYDEEAARQEDDGDGALYDEETNAYLSALAAEVVFPGGAMASALKKALTNMTDVLLAGISSEKDSILFYLEMQEHVKKPEIVNALRGIIMEERAHLSQLRDMLEDSAHISL